MSIADQQPVMRRCASCRKENAVNEMKTCMHHQMHYYVCDAKCMHDFYNPPKAEVQPAGVAATEATVRKVVTDAMVTMVAGVTGLVPPSGPGAIPDFVQAPIDRAVTQITELIAATPRPLSREQNAQNTAGLIAALEYYANAEHIVLGDPDAWDTCSGEPSNWMHDEAGTASFEDGSVAKAAIAAYLAQQGEQS
jgi:hypothetical protein